MTTSDPLELLRAAERAFGSFSGGVGSGYGDYLPAAELERWAQTFVRPSFGVAPAVPTTADAFDVEHVRAQFPILRQVVDGHPLVWLDNAATTQKPDVVIERIARFYTTENSNIHRAAHTLAARATDAYEAARASTARFLGAASPSEIVFVRGATEGLNLLAQTFGKSALREGDEVIITHLEHHSNIVPWQQITAERGAKLRVVPIDERGEVRLDAYRGLLSPRTRVVSLAHVSNALGTVLPLAEMIDAAHRSGARVIVDGAQAVSHMAVDVQALDCDFYVFSGHKVFGPTGIGAIYGKPEAWAATPPWQGGGNMISDVTFEKTQYADAPMRYEAGTGNIADAVGLGAALDWLTGIGLGQVARHEQELLRYATRELLDIPGVRIIGTAHEKAGVVSFVHDQVSVSAIGQALGAAGVAVRAGHHCAQPALRHFGHEATVRPSFAAYNTHGDIDALVRVVRAVTGAPR